MSEQDATELDDDKPEEKSEGKSTGQRKAKTSAKDAKGNATVPDKAANGSRDANLDAVLGIPVTIQVLLGSAVMPVARLLQLSRGAVVSLDRRIGDPVDIVVNGRIVARGEIVGTEDDTHFGVSLTEIVGPPALNANE